MKVSNVTPMHIPVIQLSPTCRLSELEMDLLARAGYIPGTMITMKVKDAQSTLDN